MSAKVSWYGDRYTTGPYAVPPLIVALVVVALVTEDKSVKNVCAWSMLCHHLPSTAVVVLCSILQRDSATYDETAYVVGFKFPIL